MNPSDDKNGRKMIKERKREKERKKERKKEREKFQMRKWRIEQVATSRRRHRHRRRRRLKRGNDQSAFFQFSGTFWQRRIT